MTFETANQRPERTAEDDRVAATASVSWGAGRFAVEFERREQEELMQQASPYAAASAARDRAARGTWGPVQDDVADLVVEPTGEKVELRRLAPIRHPSVPRPPQEVTEPPAHGRQRRRRITPSPQGSAIPAYEAKRMSPAARRLYGLPEQP
jgi:hypothetical protein